MSGPQIPPKESSQQVNQQLIQSVQRALLDTRNLIRDTPPQGLFPSLLHRVSTVCDHGVAELQRLSDRLDILGQVSCLVGHQPGPREPVRTPCLHWHCEQCLVDWLDARPRLSCPLCGLEMSSKDDLRYLEDAVEGLERRRHGQLVEIDPIPLAPPLGPPPFVPRRAPPSIKSPVELPAEVPAELPADPIAEELVQPLQRVPARANNRAQSAPGAASSGSQSPAQYDPLQSPLPAPQPKRPLPWDVIKEWTTANDTCSIDPQMLSLSPRADSASVRAGKRKAGPHDNWKDTEGKR
ncbi:hypothetical protein BDY17DRAFT_100982 [Neohortaea acidophila]|uniref:Zinc finger C3HC4 RING-type domain-containing protein n=1 Tax=Neohortaea acidophila TaxID=245834 RepID=A0A6A6PZ94_9PEZI|nr:uncharacterized protein BDY17DRAFT_100982 [Neohortaea acidophila]KAF2485335.1 hypothetical protein BDY17DRAFT_100982 [Neohortaea acidophila]